jgi:hypothetical protein
MLEETLAHEGSPVRVEARLGAPDEAPAGGLEALVLDGVGEVVRDAGETAVLGCAARRRVGGDDQTAHTIRSGECEGERRGSSQREAPDHARFGNTALRVEHATHIARQRREGVGLGVSRRVAARVASRVPGDDAPRVRQRPRLAAEVARTPPEAVGQRDDGAVAAPLDVQVGLGHQVASSEANEVPARYAAPT